MDPKKKQELNPELKQIYERVMNTETNRAPSASYQAPATTAAAPQPAVPQASPQVNAAIPTPAPTPSPGPTNSFGAGIAPDAPYLPTMSRPGQSAPASSPAPAPTAPKPGMSVKKSGGSKGLFTGKIIALLVVVMLAAWGVLWAKIFSLL